MKRCRWCEGNELNRRYHDEEWGVPVHDDRTHFEFLTLESAQAGLRWITVLKRRENYRKAYDHFQYEKVSNYSEKDVKRLMNNEGLIRYERKIRASINNAKKFMDIRNEFGSFDHYIWAFVDGKPIVNKLEKLSDLPAKTSLSEKISKDLKKRGFKFVGPTIIYAYMQAVGLVNDHVINCYRYKEIIEKY
jgi:DNA-3-methyladenine glycosylase I